MVDPTYVVEPTGNWYFMMVSTFLITILGTIITEKVVAPRFGEYHGNGEENETSSEYKLNDQERKALKVAGLTLLVMILVLVAFCLPANSVMRAEDGTLLGNSPCCIWSYDWCISRREGCLQCYGTCHGNHELLHRSDLCGSTVY